MSRDPDIWRPDVERAIDELAGGRPLSKNFHGYAGAGPLTVSLYRDDGGGAEGVHVGWGDGGMYLTPFEARQLARFLTRVAEECR